MGQTTEERETAVLSARVPAELHQEARIQAIREKRPLEQLVRDALEQYLERNKPKTKASA